MASGMFLTSSSMQRRFYFGVTERDLVGLRYDLLVFSFTITTIIPVYDQSLIFSVTRNRLLAPSHKTEISIYCRLLQQLIA